MLPTLTALLGLALLWAIVTYNRLVRRKHHVFEAWSGIDVQLKRRHSLIPGLAEAVKAYARFEQDTLTRVTAQRTQSVAERIAAESEISQGLARLIAVAEGYPALKANENFLDLQRNLSEVEEQIQYARRYYNATVRELNILIQSFPSRLIARPLGFRESEYFEISLATQRESPETGL
jgi:LemA protein